MGNSLFGGSKKPPVQKVAPPVEKIQQTNIADETVRKNMAKRRRATILNQVSGDANIKRQKLGAGG